MRKRAPLRMANILRAMDAYQRGDTVTDAQPAPYTDSDEQRAETAVGLVMHLAPYLRAGMPLSTALAAETARIRAEAEDEQVRASWGAMLEDDDPRIPCSVCGTRYDDAVWARWYDDPMCMPDVDELICAACAFGEGA